MFADFGVNIIVRNKTWLDFTRVNDGEGPGLPPTTIGCTVFCFLPSRQITSVIVETTCIGDST